MKKIVSLLCIMLILCVCGCAKKLEGGEPDGKIISEGGLAMQQGQWVYFIDGPMPEFVNDALSDTPVAKIYRMKTDGSEMEAVTEKKTEKMYVAGEKIFYVTPTRSQVNLCCIGIDGTKNKKLLTFEAGEFMNFGKNGVAVGTKNQIHYFDYQTLEKKVFETGAISGLEISDNYVYYYSDSVDGLNRIEISTGNIETLCALNGMILDATDSEVIFVSTRLPYRVDTSTKQLTQISEAYYRMTLINMANRVIVCVESDTESQGIYTQPIDNVAGRPVGEGGNVARLMVHPKSAVALCANEEYIFFVEEGTGDIYRMTFQGTGKTVLGTVNTIYKSNAMDIVDNLLFIFGDAESGQAYYVPADGSGQLTLIKE